MFFSSILNYIAKITESVKELTVLEKIFITAITIFSPIKPILFTILALVAADLITGIIAAKKQKLPITSSGLKRTIIKLFVYEIVIIVGFIAEKYLLTDLVPLTRIFSSFIGLTEMASLLENVTKISPELIPLISKVKVLEDTKINELVDKDKK